MLKIIGGILSSVFAVYVLVVLWPSSPCQRLLNATQPVYWVGGVINMGAQNLPIGEGAHDFFEKFPADAQMFFAGLGARIFYGRSSALQVCEHDPLRWAATQGLLDDNGLFAQKSEDRVTDAVEPLPGALQGAQAAPSSANTPDGVSAPQAAADGGGWSYWWPLILLALALPFILIAPLCQKILDGTALEWMIAFVRRIVRQHMRLYEHVLPRSVIRPTAGRNKTDKTEL